MIRILLPLLAVLTAPLAAQDFEAIADAKLAKFTREDHPGVIVCAFRDGETLFAKAYGMADLTYGLPMDVETPSNIGSTSKQFTCFAIMLLAEDGKLSLDDEVRKHIPEIPDLGEKVTIRHILTHTSGYRDFLSFLAMAGRRSDMGDFVDRREVLLVSQGQTEFQNQPGSEFNYNNSGYALAAIVVERVSGQPFHEFMTDRVFGPLGMERSMVRPSPEHIVPERARGYAKLEDGSFVEKRDLGAAVGAGGIYASVFDLQRWVENMADPQIGNAEIFAEMMTPYVLNDGKATTYGLGLMIDEQNGLRRIHHGGADIAHRSMLVYYPEINAGVTTQSNRQDFNSNLAFEIAAEFFAADMKVESEAAEVSEASADSPVVSAEDFDDFAGRYEMDERKNFILTLSREQEEFFVQATGQGRIPLKVSSETKFELQGVAASIEMHRNDAGEVEALTLHQGGEHRATRLSGDETEEEVESIDLKPYVGRYFSEEMKVFFELEIKENRLVVDHWRRSDTRLRHAEGELFTGENGLRVEFQRDAEGAVSGFRMSGPRTRGVLVERMN
ncbi:MAG: serine hydrolase domain-containing protein [Planctomycetota bacterium]|jgi:CubicO group peptidase (beta-lactamase class C family)